MKPFLIAAALAAAFACAAGAATDAQGPQGLLKGQVPDDLPALKRVAIGGFWVQYITDFGVQTKRTRGGTFFSKWKGVGAEQMQATATVLNVRLAVPLVDLGVTTAGHAGGGLFGSAKVTGVIKANPRLVEAGTVFSIVQAGGNPGHRHLLGLQKPVPIAGLTVKPEPEKVTLDDTIFGKQSSRGSGLLGMLSRAAGSAAEEADFWVQLDAAEFQPALVKTASIVFKELAQILANPK